LFGWRKYTGVSAALEDRLFAQVYPDGGVLHPREWVLLEPA
jgi:hypothetical protein